MIYARSFLFCYSPAQQVSNADTAKWSATGNIGKFRIAMVYMLMSPRLRVHYLHWHSHVADSVR